MIPLDQIRPQLKKQYIEALAVCGLRPEDKFTNDELVERMGRAQIDGFVKRWGITPLKMIDILNVIVGQIAEMNRINRQRR